jgi:hypothetical protein
MGATRKEAAFNSFIMTELSYNLRMRCMSDAMETVIKDFMRGDIPVESLVDAMADVATQIREDSEDRMKNLDRCLEGKLSYPMWYGSWEKK